MFVCVCMCVGVSDWYTPGSHQSFYYDWVQRLRSLVRLQIFCTISVRYMLVFLFCYLKYAVERILVRLSFSHWFMRLNFAALWFYSTVLAFSQYSFEEVELSLSKLLMSGKCVYSDAEQSIKSFHRSWLDFSLRRLNFDSWFLYQTNETLVFYIATLG